MRHARTGTCERGDVRVVHVDAVGHPHVLAEPAGGLEVVGRPHPEQLLAELLLFDGLRAVGVQTDPLGAGQFRTVAHQFGGDGERGAGCDGDLGHRVERGVVVGVHGRGGGFERGVEGLHREVRRESAVALAAVHGASGEREPYARVAGGADDRPGQVAGAPGEDVVVVHRRGDTAARHHRERALCRRADHRLVDAGPGRVERDEPVEEVGVGGETPGDPLVEVVVGVDESGVTRWPVPSMRRTTPVRPSGRGPRRRTRCGSQRRRRGRGRTRCRTRRRWRSRSSR